MKQIVIVLTVIICAFSLHSQTNKEYDTVFSNKMSSVKEMIELQEFDLANEKLKKIALEEEDDDKKGMCYLMLYQSYFKKANIEAEMHNYNNAIQDYTYSLNYLQIKNQFLENLNFTPFEAYTSRGICQSNLKSYKAAIHDYDTAIKLNPKHGLAFYNRGVAYHNLGEIEKACFNYNEANMNGYPVESRLLEGCRLLIGN